MSISKVNVFTAGAMLALGLGLAACGGGHTATHTARTHAASTPAASQAAVVQQPSQPAAAPSAQEVLATWYAGPGQAEVTGLQADLGAISTDAGNQDVAAVEADGAQLASDANADMPNGPGPQTAAGGYWTEAMGDYSTSGQFAAAGDFADATTQMDAGTAYIEKITALIG
jgi:hypothetical protein